MSRLKRCLCAVMAFALLLCLLPACAVAEGDDKLSPSEYTEVNTVKGLTLRLDKKSAGRYSLAFTQRLTNSTKRVFNYGAGYTLEVKRDGKWYTLNSNFPVIMIAYYLGAGASDKHAVSITDEAGSFGTYGLLEPGDYRMIVNMTDDATGVRVPLAAEFKVVEDTVRYASEPVNIRKGPGTKYDVIGTLGLGEQVSLIKKSGRWSMVSADGKVGYVYSKYLVRDYLDAYRNHPAVKLLGVKYARKISALSDDSTGSYGADGKPIGFESDRLVSVTLKKPLGSAMSLVIAEYPDAAAAAAKLKAIGAATQSARGDVSYEYFLMGSSLVRVSLGASAGSANRQIMAYIAGMEKAADAKYSIVVPA